MLIIAQIWHKIFNIPHFIFVVLGIIAISAIIAAYWYQAQKLQSENKLKRTLAEQGMSAEEIERVIAAETRPNDSNG